ncbi:glycosyltransferase family 2 protein [Lactobacillus sp. UCMA15818]|uniref:glycosyltransferase family 2 protein n=1 Tax=Lactobacillus sp. UCMA15818 TaxID=2583394 RepID=UPI0025B07306|nr:glycosyltransferase family 2 protein [Lactobacillus sp. UCMA15818]MDN2452930.1 glycosyltransferase family 2 protein [Lactobacillus sp. UCMA15818]
MISVAMTTYNGEKYLRDQIQSILSQTYPVDEIIICDDGSKDNTINIINEFKDNQIKLVVNNQNLGYVKNFEQAIASTRGDYVFLADQDDIWVPEKVEKMLTVMKDKKCSLLCSNFELIDSKNRSIENKEEYNIPSFVEKKHRYSLSVVSFNRLLLGNVVQGCTYCFDQKVREKYLAVNNQEVFHDWQLMLIAAYIGEVLFYDQSLIQYRLHEKNTIGFSEKQEKIKLDIKKPKKIPTMVSFFKDVNRVMKLDMFTKLKVAFVFYLRLTYLIAKLHLPI